MAHLLDAEAEALILECGILEQFKATQALARQAVVFVDHPTHFLIAERYSGQSSPAENGYGVICFSKAQFTPDQFQEIASSYLGNSRQEIEEIRPFSGPPKTS